MNKIEKEQRLFSRFILKNRSLNMIRDKNKRKFIRNRMRNQIQNRMKNNVLLNEEK